MYPGDRIVRQESVDSYKIIKGTTKTTEEYQKWDLESFLKANIPEVKLLSKELSQSEKAFLFSVAPYVSFDDCHLEYENKTDIGTEDLVKISNMSRSVAYKTIDSLIAKDILYKGKNSTSRQYFVNPWIFCKGNRINKVLKTMFKNYKIRVLGRKAWKDVR